MQTPRILRLSQLLDTDSGTRFPNSRVARAAIGMDRLMKGKAAQGFVGIIPKLSDPHELEKVKQKDQRGKTIAETLIAAVELFYSGLGTVVGQMDDAIVRLSESELRKQLTAGAHTILGEGILEQIRLKARLIAAEAVERALTGNEGHVDISSPIISAVDEVVAHIGVDLVGGLRESVASGLDGLDVVKMIDREAEKAEREIVESTSSNIYELLANTFGMEIAAARMLGGTFRTQIEINEIAAKAVLYIRKTITELITVGTLAPDEILSIQLTNRAIAELLAAQRQAQVTPLPESAIVGLGSVRVAGAGDEPKTLQVVPPPLQEPPTQVVPEAELRGAQRGIAPVEDIGTERLEGLISEDETAAVERVQPGASSGYLGVFEDEPKYDAVQKRIGIELMRTITDVIVNAVSFREFLREAVSYKKLAQRLRDRGNRAPDRRATHLLYETMVNASLDDLIKQGIIQRTGLTTLEFKAIMRQVLRNIKYGREEHDFTLYLDTNSSINAPDIWKWVDEKIRGTRNG